MKEYEEGGDDTRLNVLLGRGVDVNKEMRDG